jgi:hypothetical protein
MPARKRDCENSEMSYNLDSRRRRWQWWRWRRWGLRGEVEVLKIAGWLVGWIDIEIRIEIVGSMLTSMCYVVLYSLYCVLYTVYSVVSTLVISHTVLYHQTKPNQPYHTIPYSNPTKRQSRYLPLSKGYIQGWRRRVNQLVSIQCPMPSWEIKSWHAR